eukprot:TRINITY_DN6917_c0_g1_i1.p1 TRINITY_DN6917_c0_g1~~TRINITY_DN6917_c0_g1_i1.p1  ORF type:complete len:323 (-),score=35.62 TRINITY_DN6917_c0_g1_i1:175-1143(-)
MAVRRTTCVARRGTRNVVVPPVPRRTILTCLFIPTESRAGSPMPVFSNPHLGANAGIVWCHQCYGVDEFEQKTASYLSSQMEITVAAPDFYRGYTSQFPEDAWMQVAAQSPRDMIHDLRASRQYLLDLGCDKVGVVGHGMGSAVAMLSAAEIPWDCMVNLYGLPPLDRFDFASVIDTVPILLQTGSEDPLTGFSSPIDFTYAAAELARHGKNVRYNRIHGVGHDFMNPDFIHWETSPMWKQAQNETIAFVRRYLLGDHNFAAPDKANTQYSADLNYRDRPTYDLRPAEMSYLSRLKRYVTEVKATREMSWRSRKVTEEDAAK